MPKRGRCDQAVLHGHGEPLFLQLREQPSPLGSGSAVDVQDTQAMLPCAEPALESSAPDSGPHDQDTVFEFTQNDGADAQFALMTAKPIDDRGIWNGLGRLAQDVRIHEIFHNESVDSEGIV